MILQSPGTPGLFSLGTSVTNPGHNHCYAGIQLRADFPILELALASVQGQADFRVTLASGAPPPATILWAHDFPDVHGQSTLMCERTPDDFRMHFPGVATIVGSADGLVAIYPNRGARMESVRHVLLDQALPRLLAQRGELVLHAAVVGTLSGKTLLLIGESGRGKSTLTGAFFASGRTVGTDDGALVRVKEGVLEATPTYPSLRLLPDSRARLFSGQDAADTLPVADYSDKRRLPVPCAMEKAPVDAIVLLDPPLEAGEPPRLSREPPGLACMAMIRHGFQLDLSDMANLQVLVAKAAEAAELVPVYRLQYPRSYEALPDVLALLEAEA